MDLSSWHYWTMSGIILFVLEIFTPGFVLACFGLAALVTAFSAAMGAGFIVQLVVFCFLTFALMFAVRPVVLRFFTGNKEPLQTGVAALVGRRGIMVSAICDGDGFGEVKVGGEIWRASCTGEEGIAMGSKVEILSVSGATLKVKGILPEGETMETS